ncbi:Inner membrane protein YgaP [compost metagenome]
MTAPALLSPAEVAARLKSGAVRLIDIREPDEFSRAHVLGALPAPLSIFDETPLAVAPDQAIVFMCRTGHRTGMNGARLAERFSGPTYVLDGGLDAWRRAGLPVRADAKAPLELMRQVQMAAGGLILTSALLGSLVHPGFWGLSALVGAGLFVAGATGFCGMARLLALAPWNQPRPR